MALTFVAPCWRRVALVVLAGMLATGCATMQTADQQALEDIAAARSAIDSAKQAGAAERYPGDFAELEQRYLQTRGVFYACDAAQASDLARALLADANALATKRPAPPANQPPLAFLQASSEGLVNEELTFDGSDSRDPDGDPLTYSWDFGDGTQTTTDTPVTTHAYEAVGNYNARLTVADGRGGTDTATAFLQISSLQVIRSDVLFDFDRAELRPQGREELDKIIGQLQDNPSYQVTLVGHTDSIGTERYNMDLSRRRAMTVRDYLVDNGVAPERITTEWRGESEPVATNRTREGRQLNRRVEIYLNPMPAMR
jgi:outer membrane protein OmpA-like peptidoglycan-associated protein